MAKPGLDGPGVIVDRGVVVGPVAAALTVAIASLEIMVELLP